LPRGQFGARLIPVLDDLVDLLEREQKIPGFLLDGQTILLEDYLQVRPDQRQRVSRLVGQGRIETGPWYVLADEQIPSGESLIRNLLLGRADTESLGRGMPVLYSPDAFGHPGVLPSIAAQFGLTVGVAWRGIRSDRDLFRWRGPDGSEVVMYHLPPDGYEIGSALSPDPATARRSWEPVRRTLVARATSNHVAVFVGADHHAARSDLHQLRDAIAQLEPEHEVRLSRLEDFLAAARESSGLAVSSGELRYHGYTWTLQGVHGTRAHQKRRNSRLELWLERYAEPMAALARLAGRDRRPRLTWAWRSLVQSHFHDAIGGCASDAVAREVEVRQTTVEGIARELVRESLQDLTGWDPDRARDHPETVRPSLVLWNPAARQREGIVLAQVTRFRKDVLVGPPGNRVPRVGSERGSFALRTAGGEVIPVQLLESRSALERLDARGHYPDQDEVELVRIAFEAPPVGGLGGEVLSLVEGPEIPAWGGAEAAGRRLANQFVEIEVAWDGSLSVLDRSTGRHREGLLRFESEGDVGDTYTFAPAKPARLQSGKGPVGVRVLASGPMVAALEIIGRTAGVATNLLVMLFRDDPYVRCTLRLDNQSVDHRLRLRFSPGGAGMPAVAGSQFGSTARPAVTARPQVQETPVATAPAHRFVGVGGSSPFALFAPGFFEYELEPDGDILFTVLRAVGQLSRGDLATRPGHAGWPTATPQAQCLGYDALDFALGLGGSDWGSPTMLQAGWEDLFLPLRAAWIRDWNGRKDSFSGLELDGEGLALSSVLPATRGDGMVVRFFNLLEQPVEGRLRCSFPVTRAQQVRADEAFLAEMPMVEQRVLFTAQAREIISILIR
jgi:mannosylglycerate hydrolase